MFCEHCGQILAGNESYCPGCGTPVGGAHIPVREKPSSVNGLHILAAIAGFVLLFVLSGFGMFFFFLCFPLVLGGGRGGYLRMFLLGAAVGTLLRLAIMFIAPALIPF
ncbi:MAG: hypothetical protein MJZ68_09450 [archaeon]|nr:hypothetical protein [archaeon]